MPKQRKGRKNLPNRLARTEFCYFRSNFNPILHTMKKIFGYLLIAGLLLNVACGGAKHEEKKEEAKTEAPAADTTKKEEMKKEEAKEEKKEEKK
jgi:hypothetical protein